METVKEIAEFVAFVSTAFGVPIAILLFWNEKKRERFDREWGTYNALDDKYMRYLELCAHNPKLDIYNVKLENPPKLTELEEIQRLSIFETLIAVLERSYLMYHEHSQGIRKSQWDGWLGYIDGWADDPRFLPLWRQLASQYDSGFVDFVEELFSKKEVKNGPAKIKNPAVDLRIQ